MKHFLKTTDLSDHELKGLFALASEGKKTNWKAFNQTLLNKVIGLLFFNPSLRTRASFQSGIVRLGGNHITLSPGTDTWAMEFRDGVVMDGAASEHIKEGARVLATYLDALCVRSFPALKSWEEDQQDLVIASFKKYANKPIINMESALWHPCQGLADGFTMHEKLHNPQGKTFVLTWANHPKQLPMAVPNSAALIAAQLGMHVRIACPEGYALGDEIMHLIKQEAEKHGGSMQFMHDQAAACTGADVIYAKSWTPPRFIGKQEEEMKLRQSLKHWIVNNELMATTNHAIFMHCLPVRRNVVVTDEVIDGSQSVIVDEAENRMHVQNALLLMLLGVLRNKEGSKVLP
ncbi:N-acetylornithine carbamoyltransferase [Candidatus Woesearchaeota archaeon]|nr:N-acetylornithine carbamoyltransferase [Candidatus Woesearchaeota archaeon]